jgi:hypothetical protein
MTIIRRTVSYTRKNGGSITLDTPIYNITAMKINKIIYSGGDFEKDTSLVRLRVNDFIRGVELNTPTGNRSYTCMFDADDGGEWNGNDDDWDWIKENDEESPGTNKMVTNIEIEGTINHNKMKDVKLIIELTFQKD